GTADRESGRDVPCLVDQDGRRRAAGAIGLAGAEVLIEQDRRGQPVLPVGIRRPGRDEDQLRRAWRAVRLPLLEIADQALAEAAARVPEEEGGAAVAYGVQIDLFALEIVELNVWRLAADL